MTYGGHIVDICGTWDKVWTKVGIPTLSTSTGISYLKWHYFISHTAIHPVLNVIDVRLPQRASFLVLSFRNPDECSLGRWGGEAAKLWWEPWWNSKDIRPPMELMDVTSEFPLWNNSPFYVNFRPSEMEVGTTKRQRFVASRWVSAPRWSNGPNLPLSASLSLSPKLLCCYTRCNLTCLLPFAVWAESTSDPTLCGNPTATIACARLQITVTVAFKGREQADSSTEASQNICKLVYVATKISLWKCFFNRFPLILSSSSPSSFCSNFSSTFVDSARLKVAGAIWDWPRGMDGGVTREMGSFGRRLESWERWPRAKRGLSFCLRRVRPQGGRACDPFCSFLSFFVHCSW